MVDPSVLVEQRRLTKLILDAVGGDGIALAGSGAIREHGLISRPTQDIDLFDTSSHRHDEERLDRIVDLIRGALRPLEYDVVIDRQTAVFCALRIVAKDFREFQVDIGYDYRENDPVVMDVGPVLSLDDAVANKVGALFSRGESRDYLDVQAIRDSGRFSDEDLIGLATRNDPGFDRALFSDVLRAAHRLDYCNAAQYGVSRKEFERTVKALEEWGQEIASEDAMVAVAREQECSLGVLVAQAEEAAVAHRKKCDRAEKDLREDLGL